MLSRVKKLKMFAMGMAVTLMVMMYGYSPLNAATLQFDQINDGGTISYDGSGGSLLGVDIAFDIVKGTGTPSNSGTTLVIIDGYLNFQTGSNISVGSGIWTFDSGGSFILTGTVMLGGDTIASDTLLEGSWTGNPVVIGSSSSLIVGGFGIDEKNPDLLEFYGIAADLTFMFANTEIAANVTSFNSSTGAFDANVTEADVTNSVPDAAIMFLLGPSLLCLGVLGRKKYKMRK